MVVSLSLIDDLRRRCDGVSWCCCFAPLPLPVDIGSNVGSDTVWIFLLCLLCVVAEKNDFRESFVLLVRDNETYLFGSQVS